MKSLTESTDVNFTELIHALSGQDPGLCYECWRCTTGCPLVEAMDLMPTQVVHAIRMGDRDAVLRSKTIWVCASCETCSSRCPQEIEVALLMDAARTHAVEQGIAPAVPEVHTLYRALVGSVRTFGRLYELGMMAGVKLRNRDLTRDDVGLATRMLARRKLSILPSLGGLGRVRRILGEGRPQPVEAGHVRRGVSSS